MNAAPGHSPASSHRSPQGEGDPASPAYYPVQWIDRWALPNGKTVTVRPVLPQDQKLAMDFVATGMTTQSRYQRFMVGMRVLPAAMAHYMTAVDHTSHFALIVEHFDGGKQQQVGEARFVRTADGATTSAEFALAVADPWQGLGLGRRLLQTTLAVAASQGLDHLHGDVLHNNRVMLQLASSSGFKVLAHTTESRLLRVQRTLQPGCCRALPPCPTAPRTRRPANDGVWDRLRRRIPAAGW